MELYIIDHQVMQLRRNEKDMLFLYWVNSTQTAAAAAWMILSKRKLQHKAINNSLTKTYLLID